MQAFLSPQMLHTVFPAMRNVGTWAQTLDRMVDEFELRPPQRLAMFIAQCGFESSSFNQLRELMSYRTPPAIRAVYPHEFKTDAEAVPYVLNPQGLANFVYANKNGNGDVASGDGFKFRGGGLIELTGRANYKAVGDALALDLIGRTMLIEQPAIAARTAGFFWKQNDLNAAADAGDFDYTTRKINGSAMHAAAERKALWMTLKSVMGTPDPLSVAVAARRAVPPVADGVNTPGFNGNV